VAAVIAMSSAPAIAQQQSTVGQTIELETITVEGETQTERRGAQFGDDQPTVATEAETVLTERADRARLDRRNVTDPTDINRLTPGASFSDSTRSFNVRGLDRMRVATTIDGIPLPYLDDGARGADSPGATGGVASVDFDSLSAIDIVKGSDSSVFGSGMLGGGVRFRTLEPEDVIEAGKNFGGISKFGLDSRDQSFRGDQALAGRVGNTWVLVQGGYRDGEEMENQGNYPGPAPHYSGPARTIKNESDYDQENILAKLRHYTDNGHMIGFTGERFSRQEGIDVDTVFQGGTSTPRYVPGTPFKDETNRRERLSLDYRYDGGGWLDQAEATAFWMRQELVDDFRGVRTSTPAGNWRRENSRDHEIFGINASALKTIDTDWAQHSVSFGTQIYGSKSHQYSLGEDNCPAGGYPYLGPGVPGYVGGPPHPFYSCNFLHSNQSDMPDTDGITGAAFIQDEIALLDDTVRITPGVRFDYYRYTPELTDEYARSVAFSANGLPDESSDVGLSPKLRLEVDTTHNVTLFGQWAQAFRAPTVNELYLAYGGSGTYLRLGNDQLETETSNGFDIGALVGDDVKGGSVKLFYNRYKNYIDDVGLDTTDAGVRAYLASLGYDYTEFPQGVFQSINRSNVQIYGAELEAHHKWESGWFARGQFGAYVGEDMDLNVGLNSIPVAKLVLGVGYERDTWGTELILTAAASRGDYFEDPDPGVQPGSGSDFETATSDTNAYELLDFTAWWSPRQVEGLTIRAGVFNIFDEKYYEDALDLASGVQNQEYYTQPGRNYRMSATYKF
jgi:hemoglobin/transferrin/lactoferrin receptor protein